MASSGRYPEAEAGAARAAAGWTLSTAVGPSALFGANGMKCGPDGALYVAQAFGSQISALDPGSGTARTVVPVGGAMVAPDDLAFDSHGAMYATEVMSERVSALMPDGSVRVIADRVPVANGITTAGDRVFIDEFRPGGRVLELYPDGRAPRVIAEDLMFPNALAMGPDGCLYFPQVIDGEIWRVAADGGRPERVIAGLALPTAVKFDPRGELYTVEGGSGAITRIDLGSRTRSVVAQVRPGIDNFAFAPDGRLFVSHFVDGGVAEIGADGHERVLVAAGLLGPFGLATASDGTLYVADGMSLAIYRRDGTLAARPALLVDHEFPGFARGVAAAANGACFITTSAGAVARFQPGHACVTLASDLDQPTGVALAGDGSVLVCETGGGRLLRIAADGTTETLARGLAAPIGVALQGDDVYVCEAGAGRVVHVHDGAAVPLLAGLREPHGLAVLDAAVFVLDRAARTLTRVGLDDGVAAIVAERLPVGAAPGIVPQTLPGIAGLMPGPLLPFAGLAASADGRILIGADGAGAVLALAREQT